MTKRTKRLLFYSAVMVFVFFSYVAILYAQGYKYSFQENKFLRTGAIYIKANTSARVYLDDKFVGDTSFFGSSFSIGGLLPGQYTLRLARDDYSTWQKKVTVQEGYLVEFPKILILPESEEGKGPLIKELEALLTPSPTLVPTQTPKLGLKTSPMPSPKIEGPFYIKNKILYQNNKPEPEEIAKNVVGFSVSEDESKITWWNTNNEVWIRWLEGSGHQPYQKKDDLELITRFSTRIKNIAWYEDDSHIVVESLGYKIVEVDKRGGINIIKI